MPSEMVRRLVEWYRNHVRSFLDKMESEKIEDLDAEATRLETRGSEPDDEVHVCFLGNSGVGKSTLINALVAGNEIILPAGGIGPLTAQALSVQFADQPRFEVEYHSVKVLWRTIFALEQFFKTELAPTTPVSEDPELKGLLANDELEELNEIADSDESNKRRKADAFKKSAHLMITGGQDGEADIAYLIDSLRDLVGKPRIRSTVCRNEDEDRLRRLRIALEWARKGEYRRAGSLEDKEFLKELGQHASGFLAPLIKRLKVFWNSELLQTGLVLVDLPGVGIEGDVYREVTREWIRSRARAVVWVVDHRGLPESGAEMLRRSEFLNRLLYQSEDPTSDPMLMVVSVRVDEFAETEYAKDKSKKKSEYLQEGYGKSITLIHDQLRSQLQHVWGAGDDSSKERREEVVARVLAGLQVHSVSAIQYRRLITADEDDPPFIKQLDQSNIPLLAAALKQLAEQRLLQRREALVKAQDDFFLRLCTTLRVIEGQWDSDRRSVEEAERLRIELMEFLKPKQEEFQTRRVMFGAFLKNELPKLIDVLVDKARLEAERDISAYLWDLRNVHWATLRAAVRREGTFHGVKYINLPQDFALRFEEPVADVWNKSILTEIRRRTKEFGNDCVALVDELLHWAKAQGARANTELLETHREAIKADAKNLDSIGREMVKELRDAVRNDLIKVIEQPIRRKCKAFVERGSDVGWGVKDRMLRLVREIADEVTKAATQPAAEVLTSNYQNVFREIRTALKQFEDPLSAAASMIVESHEVRFRRSDAQKKRRVLEDVRLVRSQSPQSCFEAGAGETVAP